MKIKTKRNMVAKGISMDDYSENCVGRWSNNFTSEDPMICLGRFSNTFASDGSPIFALIRLYYFDISICQVSFKLFLTLA